MSLQEASLTYRAAGDDRRAAVLTTATVRAADLLGLTNATLARVLGLSPASVTRMSRGDFTLGPDSKALSWRSISSACSVQSTRFPVAMMRLHAPG